MNRNVENRRESSAPSNCCANAQVHLLAVLVLMLGMVSCAPSKSVIATAKVGAALEEHSEALSQAHHYCGYLYPFEEAARSCTHLKQNQMAWAELHKAILAYSKQLQKLAEAKGQDVGDEVESLLAGVSTLSEDSRLKDTKDNFGKAVQAFVDVVLESYRQRELVTAIKSTNLTLQKAVSLLRGVIQTQVGNLQSLKRHLADKARDLRTNPDDTEEGDAQYDALMMSLYNSMVWAENQQHVLGEYDAALLAFAKAHGSLYRATQNGVSLENAKLIAGILKDISTAVKESAEALDAMKKEPVDDEPIDDEKDERK